MKKGTRGKKKTEEMDSENLESSAIQENGTEGVDSETPEDPRINKKGIWEVSYESGVVKGFFEGAPKKIASYLINADDEGKYVKKLNFQFVNIETIPDTIMKRNCCDKHYTKLDKFCSRCGKSLKVEMNLPKRFQFIFHIPE